jgi:hypothetical protein
VGQLIGPSRPLLEQSALALLQRAGQDRQVALDTAFLTEGQAEPTTHGNSKAAQQEKKSQASAEHTNGRNICPSSRRMPRVSGGEQDN